MPLRWRRHWKLVTTFGVGMAALVVLAGNSRVTAMTSSERSEAGDAGAATLDIAGSTELFDSSQIHTVSIDFAQRDYDRMLKTFRSTGEKEFVDATVTIDGTRIEHVGLRLKGNSTLRGIGGGFGGRGPEGGGFGGGGFGGGGIDANAGTADDPTTLPWLVEFDPFVEDRRYQGFETLAIRRGGNSSPETSLNEALALTLTEAAGEPAERYAYAVVQINGGAKTLRLVLEEPDAKFAEDRFETEGVLYKALSTGGFSYRGEGAVAYTESFRQITRKKRQDMQPLINLLRWVTKSSDGQFDNGLDGHVDVTSFARYVALQNLMLNFDDMAGPGQNYYLRYDLEQDRFSVVTWDLNFAFSGDPAQGPLESGRMGGPGFRGGPPGGFGGAPLPGLGAPPDAGPNGTAGLRRRRRPARRQSPQGALPRERGIPRAVPRELLEPVRQALRERPRARRARTTGATRPLGRRDRRVDCPRRGERIANNDRGAHARPEVACVGRVASSSSTTTRRCSARSAAPSSSRDTTSKPPTTASRRSGTSSTRTAPRRTSSCWTSSCRT